MIVSALFANFCGGGLGAIDGGYNIDVGGVSLASSEQTLPPDGWKYFCEIDCHLAYSLVSVQTAATLGPELQQTVAHGKILVLHAEGANLLWKGDSLSREPETSPLQ